MNLKWTHIFYLTLINFVYNVRGRSVSVEIPPYGVVPWAEVEHDPGKATTELSFFVNNSDVEIPNPYWESPDFRLPEPPWVAYRPYYYQENNRPYRFSPFWRNVAIINSASNWIGMKTIVYLMGCYCTTAFKRLTPLAGCGVITTRHALTTASSTELVLARYGKRKTLENILGVWYDHNDEVKNSSMYASVSRIHYHPEFNRPKFTNRSHPLPCVHDMAVYAFTYRIIGNEYDVIKGLKCQRGIQNTWYAGSSKLRNDDLVHLVGFQFIWSINRIPTCWVKYYVRVRMEKHFNIICPKTEWGWFHCIIGHNFARMGFDNGGALHFTDEKKNSWRSDGWIGINAFSSTLRSKQIMNYFTVIDTQMNMNFLYNAYMGRFKYEYLDYRFFDTQRKAPRVKPYFYVQWVYEYGLQVQEWEPQWF